MYDDQYVFNRFISICMCISITDTELFFIRSIILDHLGVSLIQKIHVIHNLVYVNNSVRYTLVVSYALVIRYLLFKHVISYLLSCYLSMLSVTCYLVMSNICYMEVLFAILIFMTETISRTDEGQPRPKYIFYKMLK